MRCHAQRNDAALRRAAVGLLAVVLGSACESWLPPPAPPPLGSATDIDGNVYATVVIGKQEWMASNLKATSTNHGTAIPITEDASVWANLSTGSYSWYDSDIANKDVYGALYNWYVMQDLQLRGRIDDICPTNFRLPNRGTFEILVEALGGSAVASGALKEAGTSHWDAVTSVGRGGRARAARRGRLAVRPGCAAKCPMPRSSAALLRRNGGKSR